MNYKLWPAISLQTFDGFQVNIKPYQAIFLSNTCATNYFPISSIYRDEIMPAGSSIDKAGGLNMICINQGSILKIQNTQRTRVRHRTVRGSLVCRFEKSLKRTNKFKSWFYM